MGMFFSNVLDSTNEYTPVNRLEPIHPATWKLVDIMVTPSGFWFLFRWDNA